MYFNAYYSAAFVLFAVTLSSRGRLSCSFQNPVALKNKLLSTTSTSRRIALVRQQAEAQEDAAAAEMPVVQQQQQRQLRVPMAWDEMVRQAASAIKEAAKRGQTRQVVRLLVPRDIKSGEFLKYFENNVDANTASEDIVLVPPDESWQGGIMQLYRAVAPTCLAIMKSLAAFASDGSAGLPPRVVEDRSVDESGVDGVGLFQTSDNGAIACWLQPTQEVIDSVVTDAKKAGSDQLRILLNPQWRTVDDALDTYSKGDGIFSKFASFLGGKGGTLKQLTDAGFVPTYSLEGYICRGSNVRLLKVLDSDWAVFCQKDDLEDGFVSVGTSPSRPMYQEVEQMLQDSNIGYKYARDMGLQPKL